MPPPKEGAYHRRGLGTFGVPNTQYPHAGFIVNSSAWVRVLHLGAGRPVASPLLRLPFRPLCSAYGYWTGLLAPAVHNLDHVRGYTPRVMVMFARLRRPLDVLRVLARHEKYCSAGLAQVAKP